MLTDQTFTMLELLERIAVALERQNAVTAGLDSITCGAANRFEDFGRYFPAVPESIWKGSK